MNYHHAFHAGNFADVFKHAVLIGLLDALAAKPAALCYIDTHAGAGIYNLHDEASQKTGEYRDGVQRLVFAPALPDSLRRYVDVLRATHAIDANGRLRSYPGSPLIAGEILRAQDRLVLCEYQPDEARELKTLFAHDKRIGVHQRDGYVALPAFVPPKERRGIVLIDPPFETQEAEFRTIEASFEKAYARWPSGIFAIWYPIKLGRTLQPFHRWFVTHDIRKTLVAELLIQADDSPLRLNGCGMVIVNTPWQFDDSLARLLADLTPLLARTAQASHRLEWLVGETSDMRS